MSAKHFLELIGIPVRFRDQANQHGQTSTNHNSHRTTCSCADGR